MFNWSSPSNTETNEDIQSSPPILRWRSVETKLSWGVVFLIGGGFALEAGFEESGLSDYIGTEVVIKILSFPNIFIVF